jgi:hypothetical protein
LKINDFGFQVESVQTIKKVADAVANSNVYATAHIYQQTPNAIG